MNPQIDSVFKERLHNFSMPAPAGAWPRIKTGMDKTSVLKFWLRIAAGITLLASAGALIYHAASPAQQNTAHPAGQQVTFMPEAPIETMQIEQAEETVTPAPAKKTGRRKKVNQGKQETTLTSGIKNPVVAEVQTETLVGAGNTPDIVQPVSGSTIVYTAEEVNARFLLPVAKDDATTQEKKSSRLQKFAGVAHNLATREGILGDLRDKKNELLALNFLSDKKEKTN